MQKIVAVVLLMSFSAFAAEKEIYDVMYLPEGGTTYGFSLASHEKGKVVYDGNFDADISGWRISQTVGHALSDKFSLQAELNYLTRIQDPEDGWNSEDKGFSDPTLQAKYRFMDEKFRLDIIGGALVSLGKANIREHGDTNNRIGGHELFVASQIGQKSDKLQWSFLGQFTRSLESKTKFEGVTYENDAHNGLLLKADILNRLAEKHFLYSRFSTNFVQKSESNKGGGPENAKTIYLVGTEYQHLCSEAFLLRAGVDYMIINQDAGSVDENNRWIFNLGVNYQF